MDHHLYFLDLIATALQQPAPHQAVKQTLLKIEKLGRQPQYSQGLDQFWLFMREVSNHWKASPSEYNHYYNDIEIIVERNGEPIVFINCDSAPIIKRIHWAQPGYYRVKFNTGRIIWQGALTERDLIWAKAFPERDLDLAADTDDSTQVVTKEIHLLNSELIIKIIPQIESGCIEFNIR